MTRLEGVLAVSIALATLLGGVTAWRLLREPSAQNPRSGPRAQRIDSDAIALSSARPSSRQPSSSRRQPSLPMTLPDRALLPSPGAGISRALGADTEAAQTGLLGGAAATLGRPRTSPEPPLRLRWAHVTWRHQGLCPGAAPKQKQAREQFLATFVARPPEKSVLYADLALREGNHLLPFVLRVLEARTKTYLGVTAPAPLVYLYRSAEELRAHACVNDSAVAYYDGAIHLSPGQDMLQSLRHEYVHHALLSNGIQEPIWFQEGAAMDFARELGFSYKLASPLLGLEEMVEVFPHTGTPVAAEAFYGQAFAMVRLLDVLCVGRKGCGAASVLEGLRHGTATAEDLFDWAVHERAGNLVGSASALLRRYVESGFSIDPALSTALQRLPGKTN